MERLPTGCVLRMLAWRFLLLGVGWCVVPQSVAANGEHSVGVWRGFVLDKDRGGPLSDVLVRLMDMNGHELERQRTDPMGQYRFAARRGVCTVQVCIPGADVVERVLVCRARSCHKELSPIRVSARATFSLHAIGRDARTGERLAGVRVELRSMGNNSLVYEGVTDAAGVLRDRFVEPRYGKTAGVKVSMTKEGYFPLTLELAGEDLALITYEMAGDLIPQGMREFSQEDLAEPPVLDGP